MPDVRWLSLIITLIAAMSDCDSPLPRADFVLPEAYRVLQAEGRLRYGADRADWERNGAAILRTAPPALACTPYHFTVEWYTPTEMAEWSPPEYWLPLGLIAFAGSGYGDDWCWCPARTTSLGTPIAFCHHDENRAAVVAPNFSAFLYRALLESFAYIPADEIAAHGTPTQYKRFLRLCTDTVFPFLDPSWQTRLLDLLQRPLRRSRKAGSDVFSLLTARATAHLIANDPLLPGVGAIFEHMKP